jgi:hypothetical protein
VSSGEAAGRSGGAYRQFNFRVHFGDAEVAGFAEASGLDDAAAAPAAPESAGIVTLNRGLCAKGFLDWLCAGGPGRELSVRLVDEMRRPVMRWTFTDARPHLFTPPPSLGDSALAPLETVSLAYRSVAAE